MMPNAFPPSLRWRLPLSYALVALIAIATLGAVLLLALSSYYTQQERRYLLSNAQAVGNWVQSVQRADESQILQSQITAVAALMQTQIRVFDRDARLVADSGVPQSEQAITTLSVRVQADDMLQEFSQTRQGEGQYTSLIVVEGANGRSETSMAVSQDETLDIFASPPALLETPYSFGLGTIDPSVRSPQVVNYSVVDPFGNVAGTVEVSQGPAFGRAILLSVAMGIGLAGAVAVLLAAGFGWLVSRRLSRPILHLAAVSQQMAAGDLTTRAQVARDDEIGQLALAFNQMSDQLTGTIAALRHFVADAAHELHTPLTALRTNLDLAAQGADDGRYLAAAQSQSARLERLTDDLLRLSRLESSALPLERSPLNVVALLQGSAERYAAQAEQAELSFAMLLPETAVTVNGHAAYLLRAVDNLVDNAIKFTPAGGTVQVALAQEGATAVVTVRDNGIGLAGEPERLFSRFYRGRNVSDYPGSGLGLAIVKSIVQAHGGQVAVRPLANGTMFLLQIPLFADYITKS